MDKICSLKYNEAIDAIKGRDEVFYQYGVWNPYILGKREQVESIIRKSPAGADVSYNTVERMYYVSIPSCSDLW